LLVGIGILPWKQCLELQQTFLFFKDVDLSLDPRSCLFRRFFLFKFLSWQKEFNLSLGSNLTDCLEGSVSAGFFVFQIKASQQLTDVMFSPPYRQVSAQLAWLASTFPQIEVLDSSSKANFHDFNPTFYKHQ